MLKQQQQKIEETVFKYNEISPKIYLLKMYTEEKMEEKKQLNSILLLFEESFYLYLNKLK